MSARSVAALRRAAAAMIEQQKRKGPELPLVPVKRQRHELLLGATGSGPGAGQQQAAPGALLQAVSEVEAAFRPRLIFLSSERCAGRCRAGPFSALWGRNGDFYLELRPKNAVQAAHSPQRLHPFPGLTPVSPSPPPGMRR